MRTFSITRRISTLYIFTAVVMLALAPALTRNMKASNPLNVVYVESNIGSTPNMNSVFGFSNDGAGNLTALPGSPYLTGGTGFYDPALMTTSLDADTPLVIDAGNNLLFAPNADSNTIAVFNINSDASLSAVAGSPFASLGQEPISLALFENFFAGGSDVLSVANKADDPNQLNGAPNITNFHVTATGAVTPIANSTISFPAGTGLSQVLNGRNHLLFALAFGTMSLDSYRMSNKGTLAAANSVSVTGQMLLGEAIDPVRHGLYTGVVSANEVGVYTFDASGTLTFTRTVADPGAGICWMTVNAAGTRLYTVESGGGTLTVWNIQTNYLLPAQLQHLTLSGSPHPTNIALDRTGTFLYVLAGTKLHVLSVAADGTLTETITPVNLSVPAGEFPIGIVTALR
jgi:6-phosphogluconolactonase (cycloisomerase 2 family)